MSAAQSSRSVEEIWAHGNVSFFLFETLSAVITATYSFVFSYAALWLINKITPVKVSDEEEEVGLDASEHGENAYELI